MSEGKTLREAADIMGIPRNWLDKWKRDKKVKKAGRKCTSCKYRCIGKGQGNCNYILITGRRRGCPAVDCDKYEAGDPQTVDLSEGEPDEDKA